MCVFTLTQVFPDEVDVDDAFQRLLIDHILPLASRRCPDDVDVFLEDPDVLAIADYYKDALTQIFQFYATNSTIKHRKMEGANNKVGMHGVLSGNGDDGRLTVLALGRVAPLDLSTNESQASEHNEASAWVPRVSQVCV